MADERVQRRLAAILAADMVGYSRLMGADEEGTIARQKSHRAELIDPQFASHGGRIVKTTGDGLLVEFSSVVDAVKCAVVIQQAMTEREADVSDDLRIQYRVGVNLGDIVIDGDDILGDGVNIAARLEGLAEPGGICVSAKVFEEIGNKLDVAYEDLGPQEVKNIAAPVRAYRVTLDQVPTAPIATEPPPPLPDKPSIAVLPFNNMSGDPDQEYFADGIAEDIITGLSRFHWFFVIARNSSFSYKGTSPDIRQVARELGVQYVLEGSVRKGGNRVRITAQLIDALTGRHVWADRYDRDLDDIFTVQDEISEAITSTVAPAFVAAEAQRAERKAPENFDAWDYVMRGNWHLWRGKDDIVEARRLFEIALELDSKNAVALSGLSMALTNMIIFGLVDDVVETRTMAYQAAQRAVDLDESDAGAHGALGLIHYFMHQLDAAVAELRRALELNPNLASSAGFLAITCSWRGDDDEALRHAEMATRLNPRNTDFTASLGRTCAEFGAGHNEQALEWARKTVEIAPGHPGGWHYLVASLAYLDRIEEARAAKDQLLRIMPNDSLSLIRASFPSIKPERMDQLLDGLRKAGLPE
ncbi:MAG: adenylate/guanylate cyclase domain-containing protein [Alphaproteobacteria bacterium]|nr:adenylate/guanylate cyclase domain-containing protein [Alphaproteobacteria bacterium]